VISVAPGRALQTILGIVPATLTVIFAGLVALVALGLASPDGTHYLSRSLSISARRKASLRRDGVRCPTTVELGSL
jgi:hypothetical protein